MPNNALSNARTKTKRSQPIYLVVAQKLRDRITAGNVGEGGLLSSENELMKEFDVSRVTIRKALFVLERQSLVSRQRGRGTFATIPKFRQGFSGGARTIVEALREMGVEPDVKILGLEHIKLPEDIREALRTTEEDGVKLRRLYLHSAVPIALVTLYLPLSMAGVAYVLAQDANSHETVYSIFEQKMDIAITEAKYIVKSVLLDEVDAKDLQMEPNDICLGMDRLSYSKQGTPLEMMTYIYPPGRMQFEIIVPRHSSAIHVLGPIS